jgi:serine protease Do
MKAKLGIKAALVLLGLMLCPAQVCAQEDLPHLIARIQPAVVTIIIYDPAGKVIGNGSGFFINAQGHLITNYHVLSRAARAEIKTQDGRRYPIKMVLAEDRTVDLIKVSAEMPGDAPRAYLQISATRPMVGERVLVIGSPLGLEETVTDGMISGIRQLPGLGEILQISAPISPGSSGGPVVNLRGEVLGVAKGFLTRGQNLNFAIPGSRVLALGEGVPRPLMGLAKERAEPRPGTGLPPAPSGLPPRPTILSPPKSPAP